MRWQGGRQSGNIEDRRGMPVGGVALGGGIGTIALVLIALFFGVDPSVVLQGGSPSGPPAVQQPQRAPAPGEDQLRDFVSVVLADTEDTWKAIFQRMNRQYREPKLVLFTGATQSEGCGVGQTAMGPFYCPADQKVYIDLAFYRDLRERLGAPGNFAQAYVIAHEVGHHVQNLLGIAEKVHAQRQRLGGRPEANALQVRMELQADCFAGIWANNANRARQILEQGDIEKGLNAAAAIGDDRLQKQSQGVVVPESFTHGSSEQRVRWFKRGIDRGQPGACDTFGAQAL